MRNLRERLRAAPGSRAFVPIVLAVFLLLGSVTPVVVAQGRVQRFGYLLMDKLLVLEGGATFRSDVTLDSTADLTVGGDTTLSGDVSQSGDMTVTGSFTDTNDTTLGDAADDTLTVTGDVLINGTPDTDAANYNYWFEISGNMTGTTTKDRNYGLYIEMTRPAGQEVASGDFDEAGLKIRVDTEAITTTTGTVLRGADIEAKADNPSGTVTNLFGSSITAKSDTSAGDVGTMVALTTNAQANAQVTDEMGAADLRLFRQSATEPTSEYVLKVRNSSTTGTGADAGIYLLSDYGSSSTTDSMDYGIDMNSAQVNTADLRLSNGETIDNTTDTAVQISGFFALEEAAVIDLASGGTITPTASYQPITNATGGSINTDGTTAITDGPVAGAILVICNEDAQDVVILDNANTLLGGNVTLTGGAEDCLTVLWDGANWVGLATHDN